jgi:RNA polymerase sigma-70 factor (ECF subfamily)
MASPKVPALELPFIGERDATGLTSSGPHDETLALFDSCGPSLFRYVKSLGLDGDAARDVVQETFLALFRHLRLNRSRDNMKGWLFKVAHNLSLKHRQKIQRSQTDFVPDLTLAELVADPSLNPEQQLAAEQRQHRLAAVMRALPERDRECLYLRSEGLRYREIADVLGVSLGWVAKSVSRSFARLASV